MAITNQKSVTLYLIFLVRAESIFVLNISKFILHSFSHRETNFLLLDLYSVTHFEFFEFLMNIKKESCSKKSQHYHPKWYEST